MTLNLTADLRGQIPLSHSDAWPTTSMSCSACNNPAGPCRAIVLSSDKMTRIFFPMPFASGLRLAIQAFRRFWHGRTSQRVSGGCGIRNDKTKRAAWPGSAVYFHLPAQKAEARTDAKQTE